MKKLMLVVLGLMLLPVFSFAQPVPHSNQIDAAVDARVAEKMARQLEKAQEKIAQQQALVKTILNSSDSKLVQFAIRFKANYIGDAMAVMGGGPVSSSESNAYNYPQEEMAEGYFYSDPKTPRTKHYLLFEKTAAWDGFVKNYPKPHFFLPGVKASCPEIIIKVKRTNVTYTNDKRKMWPNEEVSLDGKTYVLVEIKL